MLCLALMGASLNIGCSNMGEFARTRDAIEMGTDSRFDRGMRVNLSPGLFRTAGWLTRYVDDDEAQWAGDALYGVRRVRASVYPTRRLKELHDFDVQKLPQFEQPGWHVAYEYVSDDEMHWLLYRERQNRIRDMFVVAVDEDIMVLARIQGQLDGLLDISVTTLEEEFN